MSFLRLRSPLVQATRNLTTLSVPARTNLRPSFIARRARFASQAGLPKEDIQKRILEVMKSFEKVDPAKVRGIYDTPNYLDNQL